MWLRELNIREKATRKCNLCCCDYQLAAALYGFLFWDLELLESSYGYWLNEVIDLINNTI